MNELERMTLAQRRAIAVRSTRLPEAVGCALDKSAEDLRNDRIEDSASYLERMQAKIDAYFAQKNNITIGRKR